jgi:hypothetical protein
MNGAQTRILFTNKAKENRKFFAHNCGQESKGFLHMGMESHFFHKCGQGDQETVFILRSKLKIKRNIFLLKCDKDKCIRS